jgi:predicted glutamine amidotransferase
MCILIIKQPGKAFPTVGNIARACTNNPDGFSMAWSTAADLTGTPGEISTFRTMDRARFIEKYAELVTTLPPSTAMIIHARIATHGSVKLRNCHCFTMRTTPGAGAPDMAFAHNGILQLQARADLTDSETFFRDIFTPAYKSGGWNAAERAISAIIGSSKFAFLEPGAQVRHFGAFITDSADGNFYSNSSYREPRAFVRSSAPGWSATPTTTTANARRWSPFESPRL